MLACLVFKIARLNKTVSRNRRPIQAVRVQCLHDVISTQETRFQETDDLSKQLGFSVYTMLLAVTQETRFQETDDLSKQLGFSVYTTLLALKKQGSKKQTTYPSS